MGVGGREPLTSILRPATKKTDEEAEMVNELKLTSLKRNVEEKIVVGWWSMNVLGGSKISVRCSASGNRAT